MIEEVTKSLKEWVATGREIKASFIIIVYDKKESKYFPHYTFNDDIDGAWESIRKNANDKPMISFDLNKKVLGVDNAT